MTNPYNTITPKQISPMEEHLRSLNISDNQRASLIIDRALVWAGSTYARQHGITLSVLVQRILDQHLKAFAPDLLELKRDDLSEQQQAAREEFRAESQADTKLLQHLAQYFEKQSQRTDHTTHTHSA